MGVVVVIIKSPNMFGDVRELFDLPRTLPINPKRTNTIIYIVFVRSVKGCSGLFGINI